MKRPVRLRFWLESGMATTTGVLFMVTLVSRDWIERVFAVEPDGGNGSLEWLIVGGLFIATISLFLVARSEWRRTQPALATVRVTDRR